MCPICLKQEKIEREIFALRADGRWEVRVTIGIDYATGEERRISRYAKTQEEAIKLLHELSFIRDHTPNNFQSVTVSEWLPFCLETYMVADAEAVDLPEL